MSDKLSSPAAYAEQLEQRIEKLRAALQDIADDPPIDPLDPWGTRRSISSILDIAREALAADGET